MANSKEIMQVAHLAHSLYSHSAGYIILVVHKDGSDMESAGNMTREMQIRVLEAFLGSFKAGEDKPQAIEKLP